MISHTIFVIIVKLIAFSTNKNCSEVLSNSQVMLPTNHNKVDDIESGSNQTDA
jgi:hypothetical protein